MIFDSLNTLNRSHRDMNQMELNRRVMKADYHGAILKGTERSFCLFLWSSLIIDLLSLQLSSQCWSLLLYGITVAVGRSKCPSYIGVEGILLRETQNTLQLISTDNKIRSTQWCAIFWSGHSQITIIVIIPSYTLTHTHSYSKGKLNIHFQGRQVPVQSPW